MAKGGDGVAEASDSRGILCQGLTDAGCGEAMIRRFLQLLAAGERQAGLALLERHRTCLLDGCHAEQRKLDCLDYLIYQMEKEARSAASAQTHSAPSARHIESRRNPTWKKN